MCKGDINKPIRIYVDLREGQTKKFKWHLCDKCYRKIASAVTHYAERKRANEIQSSNSN